MPLATNTEFSFYASSAARGYDDPERDRLSPLTSWEAVVRCALDARAISAQRAQQLSMIPWDRDFSSFVSNTDTLVTTPKEMERVPPGAFMAFIEVLPLGTDDPSAPRTEGRRRLVHAMVSLGDGDAAGTNNPAIGIGEPSTFEAIHLPTALNWRPGTHRYDAVNAMPVQVRKSRPIRIRFRELSAFQDPGERLSAGRRHELPGALKLAAGDATEVHNGQVWDVGELSDCVALAAVLPPELPTDADPSRRPRRPRGPDVFLWHVNGGWVTDDMLPTQELRQFLDGRRPDWYFVHGEAAKVGGWRAFRDQAAMEKFLAGHPETQRKLEHYSGSRLLIDSAGQILNKDELRLLYV